jgi:hypothetical protein
MCHFGLLLNSDRLNMHSCLFVPKISTGKGRSTTNLNYILAHNLQTESKDELYERIRYTKPRFLTLSITSENIVLIIVKNNVNLEKCVHCTV